MRHLIRLLVAAALLTAGGAAAQTHHARVLVHLDSPAAEAYLQAERTTYDVLVHKPGRIAEIAADAGDLARLRAAGLRLEVLEADMEAARAYPDKAGGFGIFHTYSENTAFVDSLRLRFPQVISQKWSIGQTHEGRDIWCFRISDNPDVDEDEPEMLIDGMHHAREIMASEFPILFAEHLAAGYGVDPELTWLIDHRELYVVPIVNPDGVVYNESLDPLGGGMWRKNRRDNGDGTFGVDVNRNYPYEWGYDDVGSSPDTDSEVYRGPAAGSEPETQALMGLVDAHAFKTHDTVHTYGGLTLYPWGYSSLPTVDDAVFVALAAEMTRYNGYLAGFPGDVLNYPVNGGTFDWVYGAQAEHGRVFSFSNEIGNSGDGFWPAEERRGDLFRENIHPHLVLLQAAGAFLTVHSPTVDVAAKALVPGDSGLLDFTIENVGVDAASLPATVTVATDDPWLQLGATEVTVGALAPRERITLDGQALPLTVAADCPDGHIARLTATVHLADADLPFPLVLLVGSPTVVAADDFETGAVNWTLEGDWALTGAAAHSGTYCLTDSPAGDYADGRTTTATLEGTWLATSLGFWHRHSLEEDWDYGRVQVQVDGGPWLTVASFTGQQNAWKYEQVDLSDFLGSDLGLRFVLDADTYISDDGWYLDDVAVEGVPSYVAPVTGITLGGPGLRILGSVTGGGAGIELALPAAGPVTVDLYDARGARVRRLVRDRFESGVRVVTWDGRDGAGRQVSSGVYFVRVHAGGRTLTGRVTVVR